MKPGGQCRIIAGRWRGRKLSFGDAAGLRPTPDRVRETLFNWLQAVVAGSHCLDAFAGSGALGFEAASRGAGAVVMLENNRRTLADLQRNRERLLAENIEIVGADALSWLQRPAAGDARPFDLVFLDPPYRSDLLQKCCDCLSVSTRLRPGSRIYLEHASGDTIAFPENWRQLKQKQAGQVSYYLFAQG